MPDFVSFVGAESFGAFDKCDWSSDCRYLTPEESYGGSADGSSLSSDSECCLKVGDRLAKSRVTSRLTAATVATKAMIASIYETVTPVTLSENHVTGTGGGLSLFAETFSQLGGNQVSLLSACT